LPAGKIVINFIQMPDHEPKNPKRIIRNSLLLVVPGFIGAISVYLLWQAHPDPAHWQNLFKQVLAYLETHSWALLAALAILPGLGFPISPLLILCGIVLIPRYGTATACLLGISAQSLCTTWTYLLASGPLRDLLAKIIRRRRELPELTEENALRLGLILRITPGIPYALQNIVLGVLGMKLKLYLMVSLPISALWTVAIIVTGGAIFEGRAGLAISGILLIIVLVLLTRMLQRKTQTSHG
jgi:uncharacterized membrane protein YdjX (TVP38/TMEM64 family)